MTAENLAEYIKDPKTLSKKEFTKLKTVLEKYPYFQTAHSLLIHAAKNTDGIDFQECLSKSSSFVADRTFLHTFLSGKSTKTPLTKGKSVSVGSSLASSHLAGEPSKRVRARTENKKTTPPVEEKETPVVTEAKEVKKVIAEEPKVTEEKVIKKLVKEKQPPVTVETKTEKKDSQPINRKEKKVREKKEIPNKPINPVSKENHETIIKDFFADRTRPASHGEKQDEVRSPQKKEEITSESDKKKITNDIFAKIAALKNEKPLAPAKEIKPIQTRTPKVKVKEAVVPEPEVTKLSEEKKKSNIRKVVIHTEKRKQNVTPIKKEEEAPSAKKMIEKISDLNKPENRDVIITTETRTVKNTSKEIKTKEESTIHSFDEDQPRKPSAQDLINKFTNTSSDSKDDVKTIDKKIVVSDTPVKEEIKTVTEELIVTTDAPVKKEIKTVTKELIVTTDTPEKEETKTVTKELIVTTDTPVKEEEVKTIATAVEQKAPPVDKKTGADSLLARIAAMKKKKDEENAAVKNNELISKFVVEQPSLDPEKDPKFKGDVGESSTVEKGEVITELMASIYINQGHTSKAIGVYEKLILKYPEKKSYFEELISDL